MFLHIHIFVLLEALRLYRYRLSKIVNCYLLKLTAALNDLNNIDHIIITFYTLRVNATTSTLIMLSLFVLESRIGTSVFGIHRNASIWENPNVSLLNKRRWYIFSQ